MRVIKDDTISFLAVVFGLKQCFHVAFTAMTCFNLNDASLVTEEKELWETVKEQLPEGSVLDVGMPKAVGEFLVVGRCCAPRGKQVTGQEVLVRAGDITKRLSVFGNRYWIPQGGTWRITPPVQFSEMPIGFEQSFGGEGYLLNPAGKGIGTTTVDGKPVRALPNLECPDRLISSVEDRPEPTTFLPLATTHPQRMSHSGTYDEIWLKSRWPWYPDDLDSRFFNCAPADQRHKGYFTGTEQLEATGMHPDFPLQRTALPCLRMRMFATKREPSGKDEPPIERFIEIETRIDTIWLFPTASRGIVLHRGVIETRDDEMSDLVSVFIVAEPVDSEPQPLEHYQEEQRHRTNLTVGIDKAPLAEAQEDLAAFLNRIPEIKRDIDTQMAISFGKAPAVTSSFDEIFSSAGARLAAFGPMIAQGEALAASFKADYGHLVKIDTSFLSGMKQKIQELSNGLGPLQDRMHTTLADAGQKKQTIKDHLASIRADMKAKGIPADIPDIDELPSEKLWQNSVFSFVRDCVRTLEQDQAALDRLTTLGLKQSSIQHAFLGINPEKRIVSYKDWGLEEKEGGSSTFEIPAGFVVPRFNNADVSGVAIRPVDMMDPAGLHLVEGSDAKPLAMPGFRSDKLFARVWDDLEAVLLQQLTWDFCSVISLGKYDEQPDDKTADLLTKTPLFFVLFPHVARENDEQQKQEVAKWCTAYPNAQPVILPQGVSLVEARRAGVNIRDLLIRAIPPSMLEQMPEEQKEVKPHEVEPGMKLPDVGAAALVSKYQAHAEAFAIPIKEKTTAQAAKYEAMMQEQLRESLSAVGLDPDKVLAEAAANRAAASPIDPFDPTTLKTFLDQQKVHLKAAGQLTPEITAQMDKASADFVGLVTSSAALHANGMAKLEEAKQMLENGPQKPEWAKKLLAGFGMDPETGTSLTRKQVIERYRAGESLAGAHLERVDLSKLDLAGINLEKAYCAKASFAESNLTGARLNSGVFMEADFSKAKLEKADISGTLFQNAKLSGADLSGVQSVRALFQETDLSAANFSSSRLEFTLFDTVNLAGALFAGACGQCATFMNAQLLSADFTRAEIYKWVFQECNLDGACFNAVESQKLTFLGCTGESLSFAGSTLHKARFIQGTSFPAADFRDAAMESACVMESDLKGADFRGGILTDSYLSEADLSCVNLQRVHARGSRWEKSDLSGANMRGLDLMGGTLRKSRITSADLSWANLYGVDLMKAKVGKTRFDNANMKKTLLENRVEYLDDDA